ncbi:PDZ domain [Plasmopara halstedii]|uniref:PDZ domain n=1 Tax=Plasmopara halstedii TaxID=4781 RepID=A0A0P1AZA5_PLAHL|nr:PDZ domain [Plasmopara halstedii]CEG47761.1 PDZ domain [Plasmopara halstedii]|eukprot:XP_024584130.1 PDZ domain [Plasmopara halstedii]
MEEPIPSQDFVQSQRRRSSLFVHYRHRSSSSSSLSVSACSNRSTISYPAPGASASSTWHLSSDHSYEDYEVIFTEEKLGLTLKSEEWVNSSGYRIPVTIVKSTIFSVGQLSHQICEGDVLQSVNGESIVNLAFRDVLRILKIAPRPIRLRFRTKFSLRGSGQELSLSLLEQNDVLTRRSSASSDDTEQRGLVLTESFLVPEHHSVEEDHDDSDSQNAVMSESFGDADSVRSTEICSVVADLTDGEAPFSRHSSRLAAFLRKPFRREGFDNGRLELRLGIAPPSPRSEIALESQSKAAIYVRWRVHSNAVAYHVQFSRDWTMKVWKNWSGRPQRSSERDNELVTKIFGLDFSKSYVVRVRYEFSTGHGPGEWSVPSTPITTLTQEEAMQHWIVQPR